ncbi:MAG: hypothetical protein U0183_13490 [Polyangiaceae bacterium]
MSRNSTSPRGIEPKRPTLRPRPASSLPPVPSPPRRTLPPGEVPPTLRRATLPPMPVVPQLAARPLDDDDLSLTEVRPSDDDASVPGVTEVKSVLRFNRRGRIPAADLFEAQTNRLERNELFARAGLSPSEEIETSPTLTRPEPLPQARSTIQVSPAALEQVRRLSATLERDRVPVLELVDSVDYRADELGDDDLVDDEEPETVSELDMPPARAHEVSHPELQAFRGNEDWGLLAAHEIPAPIETGETAFLGPARTLVRFDDEDEPVPPVDVAFEDDGSLVADLRPESLEVRAVHAPHSPRAAYEAAPPHAGVAVVTASGFAPVSPHTKLKAAGPSFPPAAVGAPMGQAPYAMPNAYHPSPAYAAPGYPAAASYPPGAAYAQAPLHAQAAPYAESGSVGISADVRSEKKAGGVSGVLLFAAVLVAAVLAVYYVLGPRAAPTAAVAPPPVVSAPAVVAPPPVVSAPVAPVVPAVAPAVPAVSVAPAAAVPAASVAPAAPASPAPKAAKGGSRPSAPKAAPKAAPKVAKPADDEGPKSLPGPAPAPAPEPAAPAVSGLGDLLNGAL